MKTTPLDFDYQSTTPCSRRVVDAMSPYWEDFWGNPSSRQNRLAIHASAAISLARDQLASLLHVSTQRLIFTSGATEANNLALLGYARAKAKEVGSPGHIITVKTEHSAVLEPIRQLQKEGFSVTELLPASDGIISLDLLSDALKTNTFLVSVMVANNEIGVLQPLPEISNLCRARDVMLHSDAAQALGNTLIEINKTGIDFLSFSGHKIYGPKGIGLLVAGSNCNIEPLQWGGGQEEGIRPGTLPVPLVIGFVKAVEIAIEEFEINTQRMKTLRDQLWDGLRRNTSDLTLNGCLEKRLPNNLNFTVAGVEGSSLYKQLRPLLSCSSGSACSNGSPSHVLMSLGRTSKEAEASLRLSLGRSTSSEDVQLAIEIITKIVKDIRSN